MEQCQFEHVLFLLMTTLTKYNSVESVVRLYLDTLNNMQEQVVFSYIPSKSPSDGNNISLQTEQNNFGNISYIENSQQVPDYFFPVIQNSVKILLVILENIKQREDLLCEENQKMNIRSSIKALFDQKENDTVREYSIRTKDGHSKTFVFHASQIGILPDGRKLVMSTATEVTKHKKVEKLLKEKEERWRTSLEGNNAILIKYDFERKTVQLSDRWSELTGFDMSMAPATIEEFAASIHPDDLELFNNRLESYLLKRESAFGVEFRIVSKNGYRWIYSREKVLWNDLGHPTRMFGSLEDIQNRRETEEAIKKAKLEAENANMAKSSFLANMSHEIRTPMNGIVGMTDILMMTDLSEDQKRYLSTIKTSTHALIRVVNDILDYSKIEAGKFILEKQTFHFQNTMNDVVALFDVTAKQKGLTLRCEILETIPTFLIGDYVRLRQILSNLIGNAIKFTDQGNISLGRVLKITIA